MQYTSAYRVGGDLVYTSSLNGIDSRSMDDSGQRPIFYCGYQSYCRNPAVSPDGSLIVFSLQRQNESETAIWVMNSDGSGARMLADTAGNDLVPAWSPDGTRVAYTDGATEDIWVVGVDGSNNSRIVAGAVGGGGWDEWTRPQWHPSNGYIYFASSDGGQVCVDLQCRVNYDLSRIRPDGTGREVVIPETHSPWLQDWGNWFRFKIHPNGQVAYVLNQFEHVGGIGVDAQLLDLANGQTMFQAGAVGGTGWFAWSPSGDRIALVAWYSGSWRWGHFPYGEVLDQTTVAADNGVVLNGLYDSFDWGSLSEPLPVLPLEQTFGFELAENPGSEGAVNTSTGSYSRSDVDVKLPGIDRPFLFARSYNSADSSTGGLGPGWHHPYEAKLTIAGNGDVTATAGDGQQVLFVKQTDGSFRPYAGSRVSLVKLASTYELRTNWQETSVFDLSGRLTTIKTRNDRQLTLAYDGGGRLDAVTDTVGRVIDVQTNASGKVTSVVLPDGRHVDYGYDASGRLQTVTDMRGKATTYAYDGSSSRLASVLDANSHWVVRNTYSPTTGRLTLQLDPRGGQRTFAWDEPTQTATVTDQAGKQWIELYRSNVLMKRTDPLGNATSYVYDRDFNLVGSTDARGNTTGMTYDERGNMLTRTAPEPLSYVESWTYNAQNLVTSFRDGRGKTTTYQYDAKGNLTQKTEPGGRVSTYVIDAPTGLATSMSDPRSKTWSYGYDTQGNRTSVTSPLGHKTTYGYDGSGRHTSTVSPRGNVTGCGCAAQYTTSYSYDNEDNRLTETDALANTTSHTYDEVGNLKTATNAASKTWSYDYDEADQRIRETAPNTAVSETTYNSRGLVSQERSPENELTTHGYDDAGRREWTVEPRGNVGGANPNDYKTLFAYDANGNLLSTVSPLGHATSHTYDVLNRKKTLTDARSKTWTNAYDEVGNLLSTTDPENKTVWSAYNDAGWRSSATDARNKTTSYEYDPNGNQTAVVTPLGFRATYAYDDDNRSSSMVTARGNVSGGTPSQYTWTYGHDPDGNLTSEASPLGHATFYAYDRGGRRTSVTDANAHTTQIAYDAVGRVASVTDPIGVSTTGNPSDGKTSYTYDAVGNVLTRTDANGRVTSFQYDLDSRRTRYERPGPSAGSTRLWTYAYDPAGRLERTVDANGNLTAGDPNDGAVTNAYDRDGRLTAIDYSDATPDVGFSYDGAGNRLTLTDGSGTETSTWSDAGRLATITRAGESFSYQYDPDGRVTQRTYPDGTVATSTYDNDGRLATVASASNNVAYGYDQEAQLTSAALPAGNGHVESRVWDRSGRLTEVKHQKGSTALSKFTLVLDPVGNPTRINKTGTASETFKYDFNDRVTEACYRASGAACTSNSHPFVRFTFDAVGNRLTEQRGAATTTYTYNQADQLTARGSTAYTYDGNGQQLTAGAGSYVWNVAGQLTSSQSGTTVTYGYDGDGQRLTSAVGGATTKYAWDRNHPLPQLALERTGTNTLLRRYVTGSDAVSMTTPAGVFWLHGDQLGSIANVTNASGAKQWTRVFEPFGVKRTDTKNQTSAPDVPAQYTGEYLDPITSLYNLRARQYDSLTGRFIALDPVDPALTDPWLSPYAYVGNRPMVLTDPSGMDPRIGGKTLNCSRNQQLCKLVYGAGYRDPACTGRCLAQAFTRLAGRGIDVDTLVAVAKGKAKIVSSEGADGLGLYLVGQGGTRKLEQPEDPNCGLACSIGYATTRVLGCQSQTGCTVMAATNVVPAGAALRAGRLAFRAGKAAKGAPTTVRHYTTAERARQIERSGEIRVNAEGKAYFTPDRYRSGAEAQRRLALPTRPEGYFEVPFSRLRDPSPFTRVPPGPGGPGGGLECIVTCPTDVSGLPFRRIP